MSTNLQSIPVGLKAIQPYIDTICTKFEQIEPGDTTIQDDAFSNPPTVFIDGLLLTYRTVSDKRYVSFNAQTKTITINNSGFQEGETIQVFL